MQPDMMDAAATQPLAQIQIRKADGLVGQFVEKWNKRARKEKLRQTTLVISVEERRAPLRPIHRLVLHHEGKRALRLLGATDELTIAEAVRDCCRELALDLPFDLGPKPAAAPAPTGVAPVVTILDPTARK